MLCCFYGSKENHPDVPKWERDIPRGWKVLALKLRSLGVSPSQKFKWLKMYTLISKREGQLSLVRALLMHKW